MFGLFNFAFSLTNTIVSTVTNDVVSVGEDTVGTVTGGSTYREEVSEPVVVDDGVNDTPIDVEVTEPEPAQEISSGRRVAPEVRLATLVDESDTYFATEPTLTEPGRPVNVPAGYQYNAGTNASNAIFGGSSDDFILGYGGNDYLNGGQGSDVLNGGDGDDLLYGGNESDILDGGKGYDVLNGGDGIDVFVFRKGDGTTVLADFEKGHDILDLEGFANVGYEELIETGVQVGDDVHFNVEGSWLYLNNTILETMVADDLCVR